MKNIFRKFFYSGDWHIAIIKGGDIHCIDNTKGFWFADPFLFKQGDVTYLFVEAFNKKKELGSIGYLDSNSTYKKFKILLENKTHFSYPNVFSVNQDIYIIPENGEAGGVFLYKFQSFPSSVVLIDKMLIGNYVDTSIVKIMNQTLFMVSYNADNHTLVLIKYDLETHNIEIIDTIIDSDKTLRPAGNAFCKQGQVFLPFQFSTNKYGEKIVVRSVVFSQTSFQLGEIVYEISKDIFNLKKVDRIHTLNYLNENQFVIDYMKEHFSLFKPFRMLRRLIRRKKHSRITK